MGLEDTRSPTLKLNVDSAGERRLVLHRYRLEGLLGRGGMGEVFKAQDQASGGYVALKRMTARGGEHAVARQQAELRFQREFHTLASLRHPRIVEAYDYGIDDDAPFYTMELLDGRDLKQASPMAPADACRVLRDVAAALAFLHARGVVHRDLTPRNVRYGRENDVKLIDFGVLATAGADAELVGTPSYTAPEAVYGRLLDGRADLYALGALGFVLLTGRPPYPARSFKELPEVWRTATAPPSRYAPSVGPGLDELILELLCLNPLGRPASAAAVMDRLTALGHLDQDPQIEVRQGYLASVATVGRRQEMAQLRDGIERAAHGAIAATVVEAPSGMGKSRLLAELALEGKLAGALVATTSCEAEARGAYGAMSALLHELHQASPAVLANVAPEARGRLVRVLPWIADAMVDAAPIAPVADPGEERLRVQRALFDGVLAYARERWVLLLVDDVQRADEASAAVLAALARSRDPCGLYVAVGLRSQEPIRAPAAVAAMAAAGRRIVLGGLSLHETEELVRSYFGEVAGTTRLAHWMHELSRGSPLWCDELVRYLVDADRIRYSNGMWALPANLDDVDPPDGLAAAMDLRVGKLSPDARALAEILAVHGGQMPLALAVELATETHTVGVFGSLDELVAEGVLLEAEARFSFRHDGLREALLRGLDAARRQLLHHHVGDELLRRGVSEERAGEVGWHLLRGGARERGAQWLERAGTRLYEAQALRDCLAPLEASLAVHREQGVPDDRLLNVLFMLLAAGWVADRGVGSRYALDAVRAFQQHAGISAAARARRVMGRHLGLIGGVGSASMRWLLGRRDRRGPSPVTSLASFSVALGYACGLTYSANRRDEVEALVELAEPLGAFERRLPYAAYLGMQVFPAILLGRLGVAEDLIGRALAILESDTLTPASEWDKRFAEAGLRGLRVIIDVNQFNPRLFDDLDAIDRLGFRYYRLVVQTARVVHHRYRGEENRARILERDLESTSLQLGSWSTDLQVLLFAHPAYALCGDVLGLKRSLAQLEQLVLEGFRFEARVAITRGELHRIRGELAEARSIIDPCLRELSPDAYLMRQWVGSGLAEVELADKRWERARELASEVVALGTSAEHGVLLPRLRAERTLAMAEFELGDAASAEARLEGAIELSEAHDCPVLAGALHDARARLALAQGDRLHFEVHLAKASAWLRPTNNPALIARLEHLVRLGQDDRSHPGEIPYDSASTDVSTVVVEGSATDDTHTKRHR